MSLPAGLEDLKIIGVEEHTFGSPSITAKFPKDAHLEFTQRHMKNMLQHPIFKYSECDVWNEPGCSRYGLILTMCYPKGIPRLMGEDVKSQRVRDMHKDKIAFQVLSRSASVKPSTMDKEVEVQLAKELNNELAQYRDFDRNKFAAFAELPFLAPQEAIAELKRCVQDLGFVGAILHGSVSGKYLDDPVFDPILSAFEELDVPLFLHPGTPPKAVMDAYYTIPGNDELSAILAGPTWGWHQEVAIHILRLAASGTLDRHPKLKLIVGHQGEMMPMMMDRFGEFLDHKHFGLKRSVPEMLRSQVWIAISGLFSVPATQLSIQTWGADRVLFAVDYPMISSETVPEFIRDLSEVVPAAVVRKICQTNSEKLFKIKV